MLECRAGTCTCPADGQDWAVPTPCSEPVPAEKQTSVTQNITAACAPFSLSRLFQSVLVGCTFFFFFLNFFLKRNTYKVGVLPCAFTVGFAQFTASLHSSVLFYFFVRSDLSIMMTRICFVFVFFSCIQKRPNFLGDYFNTLFRFVRFPPVDHRFRQPSTVHRCISHVLVGEKSHQF